MATLYAINPHYEDQEADPDGTELHDEDLESVAGGTTDGGCIPSPIPDWPN